MVVSEYMTHHILLGSLMHIHIPDCNERYIFCVKLIHQNKTWSDACLVQHICA